MNNIRERVEAVMNGSLKHDVDHDWKCRRCGAQVYFTGLVGRPIWDPPCRGGGVPMSINDACIHKTQWPVYACDICMRAYTTGEWPSDGDMAIQRELNRKRYTE